MHQSGLPSGFLARAKNVIAVSNDLGETILGLRQGEERRVHQVVAIKVGIEDEVGSIPRVHNHRAQISDQMEVLQ